MSPGRLPWTFALHDPEALAIRALGFIAGNRTVLERLLSQAGRSHVDLNREPIDRKLLMATLDFLVADETALIEFSCAVDLPPEAAYEARRRFRHMASQ